MLLQRQIERNKFIVTGERLSFPWFPYTGTTSHHELVGRFIQELIKDIENDVDIMGKIQASMG